MRCPNKVKTRAIPIHSYQQKCYYLCMQGETNGNLTTNKPGFRCFKKFSRWAPRSRASCTYDNHSMVHVPQNAVINEWHISTYTASRKRRRDVMKSGNEVLHACTILGL